MTALRAFVRRLADRAAVAWQLHHPFNRRRHRHATLVHYALLGVVAQRGPCTSAEVARILQRPPFGTRVDLGVLEHMYGHVVSDLAGGPEDNRLYRLSDNNREVSK